MVTTDKKEKWPINFNDWKWGSDENEACMNYDKRIKSKIIKSFKKLFRRRNINEENRNMHNLWAQNWIMLRTGWKMRKIKTTLKSC